jgi:hypothetical protein
MSSITNEKKMIDAKKMTIVFRREAEYELEFDEWYANKKDDFKTEADALCQWEAMCSNADKQEPVEDDTDFGWEQVEERCDELQSEYETSAYDTEMEYLIDSAEEAFKEIGVEFYRDWSCCNTCGHAEATHKNYVFYHGQDTERLRKGDRSVHLAFQFDDETKAKVLEMIEKQTCDAIRLHWSGEDHTKIFLTCDDDLMAAHIKEDAERQVRMAKIEAEKIEKARAVIEAEMKAKGIPTLDELIEFIKREGKDSPLVKEMNAKFQEAIKKNEA